MSKKIVAMFFALVFFASATYSLDYEVISERHSLIKHEVILSVVNPEISQVEENLDFFITLTGGAEITNAAWSELQSIEEQRTVYSIERFDCPQENIKLGDLNASLKYYCFENNKPTFECASQFECSENRNTENTENVFVDAWVPLATDSTAITQQNTRASLLNENFEISETKMLKVSWTTPLNELWGSSGNWDINPEAWWSENWLKRQQIRLSTTGIGLTSDISSDFLILIDINSENTDFWGSVDNNGNDVRFTNNEGTIEFDFFFENFDYSNKTMRAWVEITDTFDKDYDLNIFVYYDNSLADYGGDQAASFPSDHILFAVMDENTGTTSVDKTGGYDFGASDASATLGGYKGLDINGYYSFNEDVFDSFPSDWAVSLWIKPVENINSITCGANDNDILYRRTKGFSAMSFAFRDDGTLNFQIIEPGAQTWFRATTSETSWTQDTWYNFLMNMDNVAGMTLYKDGAQDGTHANTTNPETPENPDGQGLCLGCEQDGAPTTTNQETGVNMKYLNVFQQSISASEAKLLYYSQKNSLVSFQAQEESDQNYVVADFNYWLDKYAEQIKLIDNSFSAEALTIDDWDWNVNGVKVSDAQNYNYTVTAEGDYNICLTVWDSTDTYFNLACNEQTVSEMKPTFTWAVNKGTWLSGTKTIDFNVSNPTSQTVHVKLYYSDNENQFENLFLTDDDLSNGAIITCDDYNFVDGSECAYSWNTTTISDGNYYLDANIWVSIWGDNNDSVNALVDNTDPEIITDLNFGTGFTSDLNVTFELYCADNLSPTLLYLLTVNDVNAINEWDDNATNKSQDWPVFNGSNNISSSCIDLAGNTATDSNAVSIFAIYFDLIDEDTGQQFDVNAADLNSATVYSYDGNSSYDINNVLAAWFIGTDPVLRFEFIYNDLVQTRINREIDISLIGDENVYVCAAKYQQFYEQIFVSSSERDLVVFNDVAGCYNMASSTQFAYENALMVKAYTINKPYYVYTWSGGIKILLSLLDGATASIMNLDLLEFSQRDYTINIAGDTVVFAPLLNSITGEYDTNTIQIYYKSLRGTNDEVTLKIYDGVSLLWSYTEDQNANEFEVNFFYGAMDIDNNTLLKLELTKTGTGFSETVEYWFTIYGASYSGILDPLLAIIISFGLVFIGLTLVASRYSLGWFGLIITGMGMGFLSLAPGFWYVAFLQGILAIVIIFIALSYQRENLEVT